MLALTQPEQVDPRQIDWLKLIELKKDLDSLIEEKKEALEKLGSNDSERNPIPFTEQVYQVEIIPALTKIPSPIDDPDYEIVIFSESDHSQMQSPFI